MVELDRMFRLLSKVGRSCHKKNVMLLDVDQKKIQNDLLRWLNAMGAASWSEINQSLIGLLQSQGCSDVDMRYPAYKWFEPLFRNGVIEVAYDKQVKFYPVFKSLDDVSIDRSITSLALLRKIPSVKLQIDNFSRTSIDIGKYQYLELNKYPNEYKKNELLAVGIYSRKGNAWEPKYLYDGSQTHLIPWMDENPDAFNLARCFVRINQGAKMFCFHCESKTLEIYRYQEHPILVTRALFLSESSQIKNLAYYKPINNKDNNIYYNNVTSEHVKQLKRIYTPKAIEVKND